MNMNDWMKYPLKGYSTLRSLNYFLQFQTLSRATFALPFMKNPPPPIDKEKFDLLKSEIDRLVDQDSQNIIDGVYPATVLRPESVVKHAARLPRLFIDGIRINLRREKKASKDFSKNAETAAANLPDYYKRNFHFQTDGYLSESSAELYEHQVELLFSGMADIMRRLFIAPLRKRLGCEIRKDCPVGGLQFLELGSGTGRTSRFVRLAFEDAALTVTDISYPYLKVAQKKLSDLNRVDFMQADGTQLSFKDETYDVIYCVFLFHELPQAEREKVLSEAMRVLRPGGFFAAVDSLQLGDKPDFDVFLENFPKQFHEPFYTHYIKHPLENDLVKAGFEVTDQGTGFLSKFWVAQKPLAAPAH